MTDAMAGELDSARTSLTKEFAGVFAPETIAVCLDDSYRRLEPARVRTYLPLLAHRFARERLAAAARSTTSISPAVPMVLFVCTHNSGRSQMAAALLERAAQGRVHVSSAGTAPVEELNPDVVIALNEVNIATADLYPKPLTDEVVNAADIVITMGCGDSCPVIPGRRYLDWDVADPSGADIAAVRTLRDDLADRVALLMTELATTKQAHS
jgi:arsenate reductase